FISWSRGGAQREVSFFSVLAPWRRGKRCMILDRLSIMIPRHVSLASLSNSSATGSTVKESNDDPAPSGGSSRNRSRSGTGGNSANSEEGKATVGPGEQERRECDGGPGSKERVGHGEKRGQGPGQDQEHGQRHQGEEDREGHFWRWLLLVHGGGFRADSGREVGGLGLRWRTRSEPDLRDGLYRPDRPCRGDPDRI